MKIVEIFNLSPACIEIDLNLFRLFRLLRGAWISAKYGEIRYMLDQKIIKVIFLSITERLDSTCVALHQLINCGFIICVQLPLPIPHDTRFSIILHLSLKSLF